jgi:hypothetical protein
MTGSSTRLIVSPNQRYLLAFLGAMYLYSQISTLFHNGEGLFTSDAQRVETSCHDQILQYAFVYLTHIDPAAKIEQ